MMVEGPLPSLLQRRDKPTFYLPDALPQPVWASASAQLSVKNKEEPSAAANGREGPGPGPEGRSSASLGSTRSDTTVAPPASPQGSDVHQLQTSHERTVKGVASIGRSGEALPAPFSVPNTQPDFEDVVSNGEYSDFQDAHSEGACLLFRDIHIHEQEPHQFHHFMSACPLQPAAQPPARRTGRLWRTA